MATKLKNNAKENSVVEVVRSGEEEHKAKNSLLKKAGSSEGDATNHLEHFGIALLDANLALISLDRERLEFEKERLSSEREIQKKERVERRSEREA